MDTSVASPNHKSLAVHVPTDDRENCEARSGPAWLCFGLCRLAFMFPNAHFAGLGHQEQAQDEAHRRNGDRVDQRISETARRLIRRCGDEWHQAATPTVADHIRHGYCCVTDPAGE